MSAAFKVPTLPVPAIEMQESAEVVYLTPADASELLVGNTNNRPISTSHVNRLLSDMKGGRWRYNGEPIKFSPDLVLLDGQHRLLALAEMPPGTKMKFLVVYGLPMDSQDTMDQVRTRGAKDNLAMSGMTAAGDSGSVAAAVRAYIIWQGGMLFSDSNARQITNPQITAWAHEHHTEMQMLNAVVSLTGVKKIEARTGVVLAILTHLFLIDTEKAQKFTDLLISGAGLEEGNPILTLRERLRRHRSMKIKLTDRETIAMFVVTWNAWRDNRRLYKITFRNGISEENFPVAR